MSFCSLIKGITPKIHRLCFFLLNSVILNLLCVWILLSCIVMWELPSAIISSMHNRIHPPETEINIQRTACGRVFRTNYLGTEQIFFRWDRKEMKTESHKHTIFSLSGMHFCQCIRIRIFIVPVQVYNEICLTVHSRK